MEAVELHAIGVLNSAAEGLLEGSRGEAAGEAAASESCAAGDWPAGGEPGGDAVGEFMSGLPCPPGELAASSCAGSSPMAI
mmetsp:Transcript_9152/g.21984  ORF Transcript_9152/g.21984 Transcript_9152/m.21984 type:complete len:81 (-) Transcript_9152:36-278(-)